MIDLSDRSKCFYWQTDRELDVQDFDRIFLKRHFIPDKTLEDILRDGIVSLQLVKNIEFEEADENVKKGNVNIVRKVKIDGKEYVARMHPQGVKNGYFYVEKLVLDLARQHNLPTPEIIEIHETSDENDMDFIIMSVSPGITMDVFLSRDKSQEKSLLIDCGMKMAQIHKISVEGFGPFNNNQAKHGKLIGLHANYHDFIHVGLDENLDRLIRFGILSASQAKQMKTIFTEINFEPINGPRLVHNDFADWNLLTDGKEIAAILDWDECHAGDPIADLACWSTFFTMHRYESFLKGYSTIGKLPDDYEKRFHFYRLRYTISKMALRIKRFQVDKDPGLAERLRIGKLALIEESQWFGIK